MGSRSDKINHKDIFSILKGIIMVRVCHSRAQAEAAVEDHRNWLIATKCVDSKLDCRVHIDWILDCKSDEELLCAVKLLRSWAIEHIGSQVKTDSRIVKINNCYHVHFSPEWPKHETDYTCVINEDGIPCFTQIKEDSSKTTGSSGLSKKVPIMEQPI